MKQLIYILLIITFSGINLYSQSDGFGLGIFVGEPTGISGKYWLGESLAIDGALAWSFSHENSLYLHTGFLKHYFEIIDIEEGRMPIYWGGGIKMVFADDFIFGLHVPLGIAYMFDSAPLDVFLEIRPGINLAPDVAFDMSGGIGVRYYFKP